MMIDPKDEQIEILSRAPKQLEGEVLWFAFREGQIMVRYVQDKPWLPTYFNAAAYGLEPFTHLYMGRFEGRHCFAVPVNQHYQCPEGYEFVPLRAMLAQMDTQMFAMAGRAAQLVVWHTNHQFCSRCGAKTVAHSHDSAMTCPACSYTQYPRISPCIITLVIRGEEALLARNVNFPERFYSCLAGFIEAGESAEQAVHREVYEEVSVHLGDLHYYASQSWPFPHALMLGYHAEYAGGEIKVDEVEIAEANWWHYTELPQIPRPGSISRALIETWVNDCKAGKYR
ncbi:MAG TPA: NAD(+) diphosphatase [Alcanivoracaceae bacterium]|nr:NAD(+) diphosphatase [Alcanivoracaceae bacterium]